MSLLEKESCFYASVAHLPFSKLNETLQNMPRKNAQIYMTRLIKYFLHIFVGEICFREFLHCHYRDYTERVIFKEVSGKHGP